jgi:hypothetical protein
MHWWHREPTLKDMLSDSIVRAVMEADGVDPQELEALLTQIGRAPSPFPQRVGTVDRGNAIPLAVRGFAPTRPSTL